MDRAESLMESAPDSAMTILDSISLGSLSSQKDKAPYALLKSMALDKNYIDATSFDLLQPAIDYYLKQGSPDEKLRTLYYQGRIYQNMEEDEEAMKSFLQATEERGQISDSLCLGRTFFAMSVLYARQCRIEDYISYSHRASEIFSKINRQDLEIASLNNEFEGYILLENKEKADSVKRVMTSFNSIGENPYDSYHHNQIIYGVEFLQADSLLSILDSISLKSPSEEIKLDMARAFSKIGQPEKARTYLDSVVSNKNIQSPKYWAIKSEILQKSKDLSGALEALRTYISIADSATNSLISQDVWFVEQRYALETKALLEKQKKESIRSNSIIGLLCLIIVGILLFLRLRIVEIKKLKLEKTERELKDSLQSVSNERDRMRFAKEEAVKRNHDLSAEMQELSSVKEHMEREQGLLKHRVTELSIENERMRSERDLILKDSEIVKENLAVLLEERDSLAKIINSTDSVSKEFIQLVKGRLEILNSFISSHISASEKQMKQSNSMLVKATKDREDFINSTKLIYESLYPEFMASLQEKGLSKLEISFVCLYALGLRGKDIGEYLQTKRFYNISSDIREKFGLGENDTNLGLYIRSRLR